MKTEQNPITGREELGDIKTPVQALAQFYYAFNRRDLKTMSQNWLQSPKARWIIHSAVSNADGRR